MGGLTPGDAPVPRRGDVYVADLDPVVGSEQGGRRPCLVVQNDISNERSPVVIVAMFTSRLGTVPRPYDVWVPPEESGLSKLSRVMLNQVRTIDRRRLGRYVGHLPETRMAEVDRAIRVSFGLEPL